VTPASTAVDDRADGARRQRGAAAGSATPGRLGTVLPYDFRRPNKFSRDHVRALEIANETFARQFTTVLSTTLRTVSQVSLVAVGQETYDEYIRSLRNPSYLAILSLEPLSGAAIFHLPVEVVMAAVDRLLGGTGDGPYPERPLTDIEDALVRNLMDRVLRELAYAFESLIDLEPRIVQQESNPQFAQIAAPSDMVVVIAYEVRIGSARCEATLAVPFTSLQPVLDSIAGSSIFAGRTSADPDGVRAALDARVSAIPVDVSVRFDPVNLLSSEIVGLRPGDVIPLNHPIDSPLTVAVAGLPRFTVVAGRKGKRLACLVVDPETKDAP
jgi:flagellar motor switch protein FliM